MISTLAIAGLWITAVTSFLDVPSIIHHGHAANISGDDYVARARQILRTVPLVDGHNDLSWHIMLGFKGHLNKFDLHKDSRTEFPYDAHNLAQTDIPRLRAGQLGAQIWSVYTPCTYQYKDSVSWGLTVVDTVRRVINKYPDTFTFVTSADGIMPVFRNGKIASMIGLEGGYMISSNLAILRMFYELGVRYMTLTWSCDTPWADSYVDTRYNRPNHHGLTAFGKKIIVEMNRLGMMIDLSHTAIDTMNDAINASVAPVIFSHSSSFAVCPHHRNVPDSVALRLKEKDGIIMINLYPSFVNCTEQNKHADDDRTASVAQVADHFDHFRQLIGSKYLGIGADFDGSGEHGELSDVSSYPRLFAELLRRGWTEWELENVAFRNFYRVFKKVEHVRDSMYAVSPDDTLIDPQEIPDLKCRSQPKVWG